MLEATLSTDESFLLNEDLTMTVSLRHMVDQTDVQQVLERPTYQQNSYIDLIENSTDNITMSLSACRPCECFRIALDDPRSLEEALNDSREVYNCSSEESSVFVSIMENDESEAKRFVEAAVIDECRKLKVGSNSDGIIPDINIPLLKKPVKVSKKFSEEDSSSQEKPVKQQLKFTQPSRPSAIEPFFKFSLPTNFESLEQITPLQYLDMCCWICDSRTTYYQKEFAKFRDFKDLLIPFERLYPLLNAILMNTFNTIQFKYICEILELGPSTIMERKQMFNICAVTERLFFVTNLNKPLFRNKPLYFVAIIVKTTSVWTYTSKKGKWMNIENSITN